MWYIYHLMNKVKPDVIYQRRKERYGGYYVDTLGCALTTAIRQRKLEAGLDMPYSNPSVLESTTNIPFNPRTSDSELPLTANFGGHSGFQQWDSSGRAVGYAPDPTLYAPQPQRIPARFPSSGPSSQSSSQPASHGSSPMHLMSERTQPSRQNTASSTGSWNAAGQDPNTYQMARHQQYRDPYSTDQARLPPPPQPPQLQYSQSQPPMRSVGNSPVTPTATGNFPVSEQTPTQGRFAENVQSTGARPQSILPNPFGDVPPQQNRYAPPSGPPPGPGYGQRGF